jgi:hypothetical protein
MYFYCYYFFIYAMLLRHFITTTHYCANATLDLRRRSLRHAHLSSHATDAISCEKSCVSRKLRKNGFSDGSRWWRKPSRSNTTT